MYVINILQIIEDMACQQMLKCSFDKDLCPIMNVNMTYSVTLVHPHVRLSVRPSHFG